MHIPKCGGTSLDESIRVALFGKQQRFPRAVRLDSVAILKAAELLGVSEHFFSQRVLVYFMSSDHCRYISGHAGFDETTFQAFCGQWDFVTVLRHPVARWFSHYFYNRYKEGEHHRIRTNLAEFADSDRGRKIGHTFVSQITGAGMDGPLAHPERFVEKAIDRLQKFKIVGCLEHMSHLKEEFQETYDLDLQLKHLQLNPASVEFRKMQITPEIQRKVEELCFADLQIYRSLLPNVPGFEEGLTVDSQK